MTQPDFDRLARPYRWLEYATFGPLLHRTRTFYLPQLQSCRSALVLGDGDGRFTYDLLRRNPLTSVHAIDISSAMLTQLERRCAPFASRLTTSRCNALDLPLLGQFDLIATHFFLDCFTQSQIDRLVPSLAASLADGGQWLISDFAIPRNRARLPARLLVRSLYAAFRLLTGLQVDHLPDHSSPLTAADLHRMAHHSLLAGVLTTELWCRRIP